MTDTFVDVVDIATRVDRHGNVKYQLFVNGVRRYATTEYRTETEAKAARLNEMARLRKLANAAIDSATDRGN